MGFFTRISKENLFSSTVAANMGWSFYENETGLHVFSLKLVSVMEYCLTDIGKEKCVENISLDSSLPIDLMESI